MIDLAALRSMLSSAVVELPTEQLPTLLGMLTEMAARTQLRLASPPVPLAVAGAELRTAEEIAAELRVNTSAIYLWARTAVIPSEKFGRFVRFRSADVRAALASNSKMPPLGTAGNGLSDKGGSVAAYRPPTRNTGSKPGKTAPELPNG